MRDVDAALTAIRECAMEMLENAQFIEAELPNVALPRKLRARTLKVTSSLVGTKHDIISELFKFDELRNSGAADSVLAERLDRMIRRLGEDVSKLHDLVLSLKTAHTSDPTLDTAYVLVIESATNILRSYENACRILGKPVGPSGGRGTAAS
jgi:hypothetical protein